MKSTRVDDRRRIVMPPECPPDSVVTVQQLDESTWLIKKLSPDNNYKMVLIPTVEKLPEDPEWEETEARLARHAVRNLPEPK